MGTKLLGPCGQGDVEKAEPPAEELENLSARGRKLVCHALLGL